MNPKSKQEENRASQLTQLGISPKEIEKVPITRPVAKPNSSANVNGQVAGEPAPVPIVNNGQPRKEGKIIAGIDTRNTTKFNDTWCIFMFLKERIVLPYQK